MKPQPMSDAEIFKLDSITIVAVPNDKAYLAFAVNAKSVKEFALAIIAARDAQWAAMLGEPVATLVGYDNGERELRFDPTGWGQTHTPLYAIKETQ